MKSVQKGIFDQSEIRLSIMTKLLIVLLLVSTTPAIISSIIIYKDTSSNIEFTKLNDLMNIIDAKYIHLLDFMKTQKAMISGLGNDEYIHQSLDRYYADKQINLKDYNQYNSLIDINYYLKGIQNKYVLDEHIMKKEKEKGTLLKEVFGRKVKWDIYRLDERLQRYEEIFIIDKYGKIVSSSKKESLGRDMSGNDLFINGLKGVFVKDVYTEEGGKKVFAFSAPIGSDALFEGGMPPSSSILGVVTMTVSTDFLTDLITGDLGNQIGGKLFFAGYTPSTDFYIVNRDGYMITQSKVLKGQRDTVLKEKVKTLPWQRCVDDTLQVREAQELYTNYAGTEVGGASMCIFDMKWTLVAEQDKKEILALSFRLMKIIVVISLFGALIVAMVAYIFARRMSIPIIRLSDAAKRVAGGDYNIRIDSKLNDEIGVLERSFTGMINELDINRQTLKIKNDELLNEKEKVVRSEKLAAVGQLASSIGHELRNPLGIIGNSAYYLNMKLKDADEKIVKHIDILQREVLRSNTIITDLLDFSRASVPTVEDVDLNDVIKKALTVTELPENVVMETRLAENLPLVLADPGQIRQVFQNLISNACQAMPEGGRLEINTAVEGGFAETKIRDTGDGISEENLRNVFEPLFTTKAKGIGLGLAIVKGIVESHKGLIEVVSEVGKCTTFTVKLPLKGGRGVK